jgi:hypothetical protein
MNDPTILILAVLFIFIAIGVNVYSWLLYDNVPERRIRTFADKIPGIDRHYRCVDPITRRRPDMSSLDLPSAMLLEETGKAKIISVGAETANIQLHEDGWQQGEVYHPAILSMGEGHHVTGDKIKIKQPRCLECGRFRKVKK